MIAGEFDGLSIAVLKGISNYLSMTALQDLADSTSRGDRPKLERLSSTRKIRAAISSPCAMNLTLSVQQMLISLHITLSMNKSSVDDEVFYQHAKDMATIASIIIVNHTFLGSIARSNGSGIPITLENLILTSLVILRIPLNSCSRTRLRYLQ